MFGSGVADRLKYIREAELKRSFHTQRPQRAEFLALPELGFFRSAGAGRFHVLRGIVEVAQVREDGEILADRVFAGEINIGTLRAPDIRARFDATAGHQTTTIASDIVPVKSDIVFLARKADAPASAAWNIAGEIGSRRANDALGAPVGEHLDTTCPTRQKGKRLPVINVDTLHPDTGVQV